MKKTLRTWLACMPAVLCFHSAEAETASDNVKLKEEKHQQIDQELQKLFAELNKKRLQQQNTEMKAQSYLLDDWSRYAEKIKEAEEDEKEISAIKQRILELYGQKQALIDGAK